MCSLFLVKKMHTLEMMHANQLVILSIDRLLNRTALETFHILHGEVPELDSYRQNR